MQKILLQHKRLKKTHSQENKILDNFQDVKLLYWQFTGNNLITSYPYTNNKNKINNNWSDICLVVCSLERNKRICGKAQLTYKQHKPIPSPWQNHLHWSPQNWKGQP